MKRILEHAGNFLKSILHLGDLRFKDNLNAAKYHQCWRSKTNTGELECMA